LSEKRKWPGARQGISEIKVKTEQALSWSLS